MTPYQAVRCVAIVLGIVCVVTALVSATDGRTPVLFGVVLIVTGIVLALAGFQPWDWPR